MPNGKKSDERHSLNHKTSNNGLKTLYISDLDGTLLGNDAAVSPESTEMLNEAISAGAMFSVATARTPATVASILSDIDTRLPMAVMTGATLWNAADRQYSHTRFLPEKEARKVIEIYRETGFSSFVYTLRDNMLHIYHIGQLSWQERMFMAEREHSSFKTFHIPPDGESALPDTLDNVVLFYGIRNNEISLKAHESVSRLVECSPLCYHDIYGQETAVAEVFAKEATKAEGIRTLAQIAGAQRVVAFGDNINDLPMMREADLAVAVSNALPEVKDAADIVIGANTDDAVARFILYDSSMTDR